MQQTPPKNQHYIPQFILKNFADNYKFNYWDVEENTLSEKKIKECFMELFMYNDEINHEENPFYIENKLSSYENKVANIINLFQNKDEITLSQSDLEKITIFCFIQCYRNKARKKQYAEKDFDYRTEKALAAFTKDDNYLDLWRRNLSALVDCKNYKHVIKNTYLDETIKNEFKDFIKNFYLIICEATKGEFLITDLYPTLEMESYESLNIYNEYHYIFPISLNRAIIFRNKIFLNKNHIIFNSHYANKTHLLDLTNEPKVEINNKNDRLTKHKYNIHYLTEDNLQYINALILNEARIGIAFNDLKNALENIEHFNNISNTKQKHYELEKSIKKLMNESKEEKEGKLDD